MSKCRRNVWGVVGFQWSSFRPAKWQQAVVLQLVIAPDEAGGERAFVIEIQLLINLHLILSRDRRTRSLLQVPIVMRLVILWIDARQIVVVAGSGIIVVSRLAAVVVDIEQLRRQTLVALCAAAIGDDAQRVGAARAPHDLSSRIVSHFQLQECTTKTNAAWETVAGVICNQNICNQFLIADGNWRQRDRSG